TACRNQLNKALGDFMSGPSNEFSVPECTSLERNSILNWGKTPTEVIKNLLVEDPSSARIFAELNSKSSLDNVLNILSFISDILTVSDSKELTQIILSKAAPVSSYKISRNSRFSWG